MPEGEYFKEEFDRFVVEPQPDGVASVKFYKEGLQWPVGARINKWKHDNIKMMLEPLAEVDASRAEEYKVPGVQFWTKGNEFTTRDGKKSNYKDLRKVEATL
jgi:hypothetical protein